MLLTMVVFTGGQGLLLTIKLLYQQKWKQQPLCPRRGAQDRRLQSKWCPYACVPLVHCGVLGFADTCQRRSCSERSQAFVVSVLKKELTESSIWSFTALPHTLTGSACSPGLDPCVGCHHEVVQGLRKGAS